MAAASFLTRVPLGRRTARVTESDLRGGAAWFPAVGAAVGVATAGTGWLVAHRLPASVSAVVAVTVATVLTGALHLDGLADTLDGLGAASTGGDALRAMREAGIGAFGTVGLVLDLALRIGAIGSLLAERGFPWAIVASAGAARVCPLLLARRLPYLRAEGGAGRWVGDGPSPTMLTVGVATAVGAAAVAGSSRAAAIVAVVVVVTFGVGALARRSFGGVTGDVFGAAVELAETLSLAGVAAVARH